VTFGHDKLQRLLSPLNRGAGDRGSGRAEVEG
jgi:hypothetical protein